MGLYVLVTGVLNCFSQAFRSVRTTPSEHPEVTVGRVVKLLETTKPTATKAISALVDAGVLVETSWKRRDLDKVVR
jgi:Fic family protein